MSILEMGALGELLAAVAVLITLVFLTIQIRQNTSIVKANAFQAWVGAANAPFESVQQNDSVMQAVVDAMNDPNRLTNYTALRYGFWLHQLMHTAQATHYLHANGAIPNDVYEAELDRTGACIKDSPGKEWWEAGARTQFGKEFVSVIESRARSSEYASYTFSEGRGFHAWESPSNDIS